MLHSSIPNLGVQIGVHFGVQFFEGFESHSNRELSNYFATELWHFLQNEASTIT